MAKESSVGYANQDMNASSNECHERQIADQLNDQSIRPKLNFVGDVIDDERGKDCFFVDSCKRIDFILVWSKPKEADRKAELKEETRQIFVRNLLEEGLEVEEDFEGSNDLRFLKIHAPFDLLVRYADLLKIRMPIKEKVRLDPAEGLWEKLYKCAHLLMRPFYLDPSIVPPLNKRFSHPFEKEKIYLYDVPEEEDQFFTRATRCQIVDFILRRTEYSTIKESVFNFGIKNLIADNTFLAAYPLHEGSCEPNSRMSMRKILFEHWASFKNLHKVQPLNCIRLYFGEKIGFYFAWLGYYNFFLFFASIAGVAVFLYGLYHIYTNPIAVESCDKSNMFVMCPKCYRRCGYWGYHRMCYFMLATHLFDNPATVFFAAFMALWGTVFLEFWKREEASIQFLWDLKNFEEEEETPRPEYLVRLSNSKHRRINPLTGQEEQYIPFWTRRLLVYLTSASIMFFLVLVLIVVVVGITVYRISVQAALYMTDNNSLHRNAPLIVSITAAVINLILIFLLNYVYEKLAIRLTDWECLRTQQDHDNSLCYKIYVLQVVNFYSSLFYIAFLKGRFSGSPAEYSKFLGARLEECEGGSCLTELCIQLAIILIGKQLLKNQLGMILPYIRKCFKNWKTEKKFQKAWQKDFNLEAVGNLCLLQEYLEMMIQFGFVTLFVAAFPLAPIFALINNLFELRTDAKKFLVQYRRATPVKVLTIGVWQDILYGLTRASILTNACLIAFTSNFIQRELYRRVYSPTGTLEGFVNDSLAYFDVNDFRNDTAPDPGVTKAKYANTTICRYLDYRHPPWHPSKYEYTQQQWHKLAAQFIFVVLFENLVLALASLASYLIPDVSNRVAVMRRKEASVVAEVVLKTELSRAKGHKVFVKVGDLKNIGEDCSSSFGWIDRGTSLADVTTATAADEGAKDNAENTRLRTNNYNNRSRNISGSSINNVNEDDLKDSENISFV